MPLNVIDLLCELISLAVFAEFGVEYKGYYLYFLPFYGGLLLSAILPYSKKHMLLVATAILSLGGLTFAVSYRAGYSLQLGLCLVHFAGGFIDGITPVYCINKRFINRIIIVFEVSPKEVFAFAGVVGYLAVSKPQHPKIDHWSPLCRRLPLLHFDVDHHHGTRHADPVAGHIDRCATNLPSPAIRSNADRAVQPGPS